MDPVSRTPTEPANYAALSLTYSTLLVGVVIASRDSGEERLRSTEILPLGLATFALSKLIAKEKVETWVREPFVEETPDGEKRPKGTGMRYAVGELLTCSRCLGAWSALGLTAVRVHRPQEARLLTTVLAATAVNDFLQSGFTFLCSRANVTQKVEEGELVPADGAGRN